MAEQPGRPVDVNKLREVLANAKLAVDDAVTVIGGGEAIGGLGRGRGVMLADNTGCQCGNSGCSCAAVPERLGAVAEGQRK
jgi:hypothetical protein